MTMENERLLAAYASRGSPTALDDLVRRNQNLLHHILKRFAYAHEPYEDLLQVANLGLIKAAQRYDAARGVLFSTYATAIVDGELRHHLRDSLLLRQPRWVKKIYGEIQVASSDLTRKLGRPPEVREIAAALNIDEAGILEVINLYARVDLHSQNEPFGGEDMGAAADRQAMRSQRQESFALPIEDRIVLYDALDKLTGFHRRIVYLLFFKQLTQSEVAVALGLTQKKVSREQTKALSQLRQTLDRRVA